MDIGSLLVGSFAGGFFGLAHSWLVIKLFFWPRVPVDVLGRRVPLTPGLFVAGKERFARELSAMLVDRFVTPIGLHRALGQALESGAIKKAIRTQIREAKSDLVAIALGTALRKLDGLKEEDIVSISNHAATVIKTSGAVERAVIDGIMEMDPEETERMVMQVVHKELRAVIWLGFPMGVVTYIVPQGLKWIVSLW